MTIAEIEELVRGGESPRLEFKATTGQLRRGAETLCAFLNADGGQVLFGVTPKGDIVGQKVSDNTLRDVAATLQRFDPPAPVSMARVTLGRSDHELLVLTATRPMLRGCSRTTDVRTSRSARRPP